MAACMVTDEIKKIHMDYNTKMANLQKEKETAEAKEYERIANIKKLEENNRIAAIKRQTEEANLAVKTILEEDDRESSMDTSDGDEESQERK